MTMNGSPGDVDKNVAIQAVVEAYERTFPGRIAGYYVEGSYADGTQLPTSDIDLAIIFYGHLTTENGLDVARHLWERCIIPSHMELDISLYDEADLQGGVWPHLKLGSTLISGSDVLQSYPIIPIDTWAHMRMRAAHYLIMHIYQREIEEPLPFPDPGDEFYGYANRTVTLADGREVFSTRNLIRTTGWAATALIAELAHEYVPRKRDCHLLYRRFINDEWSPLLEDIYHYCRATWMYLLPERERDRRLLRTMCERTLAFERYFVGVYRQRYRNDEL
jgi:predicted nucleotidyltransferase